MSALANRDFVKMNGLGNEIVIVDLRRAPSPISAAEARAAARREPYDQLMALYPPDGATDASIRIFNNDGSEAGACGNGMRCVASLISAETGRAALKFETAAGVVSCWRATFSLGRDSAGQSNARYARHRPAIRTTGRANPACAVGGEYGQSARDLLGGRSAGLRPAPDRAGAGTRPVVSGARQYHVGRDAV